MVKKNVKKQIFLAIAVFIVFSLSLVISSRAFDMSGYGYKLQAFATEGGDSIESSSYISTLSFGQPATGWVEGGPYRVCLGIFCTEAFEADYEIPLSGDLNYKNGSAVANSDVEIVIIYKTNNFRKITTTDSAGNFDTIIKVPEFVYDKNFKMEIYAYGEIDAIYECNYDTATEQCS